MPRRRSAQPVARPITPAPMTATFASLAMSGSGYRPGDLEHPLLPRGEPIDLARRPRELAAVLARPLPDRVVRAHDLRVPALRTAHDRVRDLARRQRQVAVARGQAGLDGADAALLALVARREAVVEGERVPGRLMCLRELPQRADH